MIKKIINNIKFTKRTKFVYLLILITTTFASSPAYAPESSFFDKLFGGSTTSSANTGTDNKSGQTPSSSNQTATNQTAQQTIPLEQAFKNDTYENFASQEDNERKIFDESLLGPQS